MKFTCVGHFLWGFCDCSQSSTSVVLHIGSIGSQELANVQLLFDNQYIFGTPRCFWRLKNTILQDFAIAKTHVALVMWVWLVKFCIRIIEVSDNWGSDKPRMHCKSSRNTCSFYLLPQQFSLSTLCIKWPASAAMRPQASSFRRILPVKFDPCNLQFLNSCVHMQRMIQLHSSYISI